MDTTLVGVTLLSMAMAIGLSVVVWRLLRDERRRSEARVAALIDMAAQASEPAKFVRTPVKSAPVPRDVPPATLTSRSLDLPLRESSAAISATPLFSEPERSSPWRGRAVIMGGLALAAAAVLLFALAARDRGRIEQRSAASRASAPAPTAMPPLELLSLRDTRDGASLTIAGLVQNPRGGQALKRVTVTAFAFDRNGAFLASGQALLDITSLAPGDESPFVVAVRVSGDVARYRIGFRGEDGQVIAHFDKRQQGTVAHGVRSSLAGT
jgi:hypothetical protein